MPPRKSREPASFNLAFLDIMCCGLGAVILIFLIIKHGNDRHAPAVESIDSEFSMAIREAASLEAELVHLVEMDAAGLKKAGEVDRSVDAAAIQLNEMKAENQARKGLGKKLKNTSESLSKKQSSAPIPIQGKAVEQYLIGMSVEGRRIAILLDASSSMTDADIVDIVRRKVRSDEIIKQGPKWQRALKSAMWLISKVPDSSEYAVITFNSRATFAAGSSAWQRASDKTTMAKLSNQMPSLVPKGGTNIEAAFDAVLSMKPRPDKLYVVTDGLPTIGVGSAPYMKGCKKNTVSRECREALFIRAAEKIMPAGIAVNVILLPMEGDPSAADLFWQLSRNTGGVLLSPAASWP